MALTYLRQNILSFLRKTNEHAAYKKRETVVVSFASEQNVQQFLRLYWEL